MKRTTTGRLPSIILIIILLSLATGVKAQRVTDSGYRTVATIKSDGTIQEAHTRPSDTSNPMEGYRMPLTGQSDT